jgi:hypothetical protein
MLARLVAMPASGSEFPRTADSRGESWIEATREGESFSSSGRSPGGTAKIAREKRSLNFSDADVLTTEFHKDMT